METSIYRNALSEQNGDERDERDEDSEVSSVRSDQFDAPQIAQLGRLGDSLYNTGGRVSGSYSFDKGNFYSSDKANRNKLTAAEINSMRTISVDHTSGMVRVGVGGSADAASNTNENRSKRPNTTTKTTLKRAPRKSTLTSDDGKLYLMQLRVVPSLAFVGNQLGRAVTDLLEDLSRAIGAGTGQLHLVSLSHPPDSAGAQY